MKTGLNDIRLKIQAIAFTGKYVLISTFSENVR